MPTDYNKIRDDNIREYGQGTRHLSFLGRLYTDRTHFIFELLQNAEDAGASKVLFQLFKDKLEVRHDGRLFNEKDVRGICGVGEGTKAEDLNQIGKFGIGFKSVYAYTTTPEIYSGDESFKIEYYVRPYAVQKQYIGDSWTTLFVFPFNKEDVEPVVAAKVWASLRKAASTPTSSCGLWMNRNSVSSLSSRMACCTQKPTSMTRKPACGNGCWNWHERLENGAAD